MSSSSVGQRAPKTQVQGVSKLRVPRLLPLKDGRLLNLGADKRGNKKSRSEIDAYDSRQIRLTTLSSSSAATDLFASWRRTGLSQLGRAIDGDLADEEADELDNPEDPRHTEDNPYVLVPVPTAGTGPPPTLQTRAGGTIASTYSRAPAPPTGTGPAPSPAAEAGRSTDALQRRRMRRRAHAQRRRLAKEIQIVLAARTGKHELTSDQLYLAVREQWREQANPGAHLLPFTANTDFLQMATTGSHAPEQQEELDAIACATFGSGHDNPGGAYSHGYISSVKTLMNQFTIFQLWQNLDINRKVRLEDLLRPVPIQSVQYWAMTRARCEVKQPDRDFRLVQRQLIDDQILKPEPFYEQLHRTAILRIKKAEKAADPTKARVPFKSNLDALILPRHRKMMVLQLQLGCRTSSFLGIRPADIQWFPKKYVPNARQVPGLWIFTLYSVKTHGTHGTPVHLRCGCLLLYNYGPAPRNLGGARNPLGTRDPWDHSLCLICNPVNSPTGLSFPLNSGDVQDAQHTMDMTGHSPRRAHATGTAWGTATNILNTVFERYCLESLWAFTKHNGVVDPMQTSFADYTKDAAAFPGRLTDMLWLVARASIIQVAPLSELKAIQDRARAADIIEPRPNPLAITSDTAEAEADADTCERTWGSAPHTTRPSGIAWMFNERNN